MASKAASASTAASTTSNRISKRLSSKKVIMNAKESKILAKLSKNVSNMRVLMGDEKHPLLPNQIEAVKRVRAWNSTNLIRVDFLSGKVWYTPGDGGKDCEIVFDEDSTKSNYHGVALQLEYLSRLITICLENVQGDTIASDIRDIVALIAKPIASIKQLDRYLVDARRRMSKIQEYVPALPTGKIEYPSPEEVQKSFDKSIEFLKERMAVQIAHEDFEGCIRTRKERSELQEFKNGFDLGFRMPEFQYSMRRIITHGKMPKMAAVPKDFRVITWNVWKGAFHRDTRHQALLQEALAHKPHVICLQEVTKDCVALLDKHAQSGGLLEHYHGIHSSDSRIGDKYGVLVLTHRSLGEPARIQIDLESRMNRWCELVSWKVDPLHQITIATTHLESASYNTKRRVHQLGNIFHDLAKVWRFSEAKRASVVLCGDFNFSPKMVAEQRRLEQETTYQDVWPALRGDDPGYTEDTDINVMRYVQSGCNDKKVRFDRMMLHSPGEELQAAEVSMLGTKALASGDEDVFPSDHFGLFARYKTDFGYT